MDPAGGTWSATSDFTCDGSVCTDPVGANELAFLPFNPAVGHVYVLSCELNPPSGSTGNWEAVGYSIGTSPGQAVNDNGTWLLDRDSGGLQMFNGPITADGAASANYDVAGPTTFQVVLDTTTGDATTGWTVTFLQDGIVQFGPTSFGSSSDPNNNPTYNGIFFENYQVSGVVWDNLLLTDSVLPPQVPTTTVDVPASEFGLPYQTITIPYQAFSTLPITYQWQLNGTNVTNNARISGAKTNALVISSTLPGDAGSYQVIATDSAGSTTSRVCTVTVGTLPLSFNGVNAQAWTVDSMGGNFATNALLDNLLTLTDGNNSEVREVWFNNPQYIGGFEVSFTYQATGTPTLADGVSFCVQNDPRGLAAEVGAGGGLGVYGYPWVADISPSAELALNLYNPTGYSWNTNANITSPTQVAPGTVNLLSGDPITVTLLYANGQVAISMTDTVAATSFSTTVATGDLTSVLGTNKAYVGFTGSDGGYVSIQTVTNFSFVSLPEPNIALSATNTALISWSAQAGGFVLQQNGDLTTTNWVNVTNPQTLVNGSNVVGWSNRSLKAWAGIGFGKLGSASALFA